MLIVCIFLLSGCSVNIKPIKRNIDQSSLTGQQLSDDELDILLSGAIKVKDPEKLLELQYLKEKGLISEKAYQAMIRMEQDSQEFLNCPINLCSVRFDRKTLQEQLKKSFTH